MRLYKDALPENTLPFCELQPRPHTLFSMYYLIKNLPLWSINSIWVLVILERNRITTVQTWGERPLLMPGRCLNSVSVEGHRSCTWLLFYHSIEHLGIESVWWWLRVFPLLGRVHWKSVEINHKLQRACNVYSNLAYVCICVWVHILYILPYIHMHTSCIPDIKLSSRKV